MSSGKCKLKQQCDTTTHLLEWLKSGTLTTSNAGKDLEQWELPFIAGGIAKWCSHFGRHFVGFLQNHTLTMLCSNTTHCYLSKGVENLPPQQNQT